MKEGNACLHCQALGGVGNTRCPKSRLLGNAHCPICQKVGNTRCP